MKKFMFLIVTHFYIDFSILPEKETKYKIYISKIFVKKIINFFNKGSLFMFLVIVLLLKAHQKKLVNSSN